jgi:hypothetical protein
MPNNGKKKMNGKKMSPFPLNIPKAGRMMKSEIIIARYAR